MPSLIKIKENNLSKNDVDCCRTAQSNCCIINIANDDIYDADEEGNLANFTCKICLNKYIDDSCHTSNSTSTYSFDVNSNSCETNKSDEFNLNDSINFTDAFYNSFSIYQIQSCKCKFCVNCLKQYIKQCIANCDVCPINCPDSSCKLNGSLTKPEVKYLILSPVAKPQQLNLNNNKISGLELDDNNNNIETTKTVTINEEDREALLLTESNDENDEDDDCKELRQNLYKKYLNMYKNNEILRDPTKVHCSRPDCQNVCTIKLDSNSNLNNGNSQDREKKYSTLKTKVVCDKCNYEFCSICFKKWSSESNGKAIQLKEIVNNLNNSKTNSKTNKKYIFLSKNECDCDLIDLFNLSSNIINSDLRVNNNKKAKNNDNGSKSLLLNDFENIKRCPKCSILIERADGCAQIMCKACRHTFCFYCLTSLDDDFLLKHFTKSGPCKGKLGHSKFSLFMHRISVVSIFVGTIIFVIVLSPFILISLPFLVFSDKCRKMCLKISAKFN